MHRLTMLCSAALLILLVSPVPRAPAQSLEQEAKQLAARLAQSSGDEADAILARLSDIGPEARAAVPAMVDYLRKSEFKLEIVGALAATRGEALPELRPLLRDNDSKVRFWALCVLDDMGVDAESAVVDVFPLLQDEDPEVRQTAMWCRRSRRQ